MLSGEQALMISIKHSQLYMYIFGIEEKLVLVLFMHQPFLGFVGLWVCLV